MDKNIINMYGINIDNVDMEEAITNIEKMADDKQHYSYVLTPNVDHIVKVDKDEEFLKIYKEADLVIADGMPLIWASKILNKPLKEKVSGSDLFPLMCKRAAEKGHKVFFLGGMEGVADKAAKVLTEEYKDLKVVGTYCPPFGFEHDEKENEYIINLIKSANPDILFVGVGAPKQEKWIYHNKEKYQVPVSLGIGASFDFIAGNVKRAPKWMQNSGLEWFYRFTQEPKRMFKRYFVDDTKFISMTFNEIRKK